MQLHCCDSNLVISYSYYFELKQFPWICLSVILVTGISYFKLLDLFRTIFDFEFIVGELLQVNPDNSRAMSALTVV